MDNLNVKKMLKKIWLCVSPTYRQVCGIEEHLYRMENIMLRGNLQRVESMLEAQIVPSQLPPAQGSRRDIQLLNLMILKKFHEVCENNKLSYWLDFGTLAGAMVHKGFVPWDDDIDVCMPADDFYKFSKLAEKELKNTDFAYFKLPSETGKMIHRQFAPENDAEVIDMYRWNTSKKFMIGIDVMPHYYAKANISHEMLADSLVDFMHYKYKMYEKCNTPVDYEKLVDPVKKFNDGLSTKKPHKYIFQGGEIVVGQPRIRMLDDLFPLKKVKFENYDFFAPAHPENFLLDTYNNFGALPMVMNSHLCIESLRSEDLKKIKEIVSKHPKGKV